MTRTVVIVLALLLTAFLSEYSVGAEKIGADPSAIKKHMTRTEILGRFGEPIAKTADGRFALYEYQVKRAIPAPGGLGMKQSLDYRGRLLLEFDDNNRVKTEHDHVCYKGDAQCAEPVPSLLAMLDEFYSKASFARQYQSSIVRTSAPYIKDEQVNCEEERRAARAKCGHLPRGIAQDGCVEINVTSWACKTPEDPALQEAMEPN